LEEIVLINKAKITLKMKKLEKQLNGIFNNVGSADENK
jgi:hypothetical protein